MSNATALYKRVYGETTKRFGPPLPIVVKAAHMLKPNCSVLDIGANEGRHSLYLAAHGHRVTAVDLPGDAIQRLRKVSEEANLVIQVMQNDILKQGIDGRFHGIFCTFVLNFFKSSDALEIIDLMKSATLHGGINVVSLMTNNGGFYKQYAEEGWYPEQREFRNFWNDWNILFSMQDWRTSVFRLNGGRLRNYCVHLITRKPN